LNTPVAPSAGVMDRIAGSAAYTPDAQRSSNKTTKSISLRLLIIKHLSFCEARYV
jgi:hypothetical protein